MDTKNQFKLRKFVNELKKYRARHTELITVYIPIGYDLNKIIQHLAQEQGTASNIKDKTTRQNVQDALERMIRHLRLFKVTPSNGLAAFSGNVSEQEGKQDIQVWSVDSTVPGKLKVGGWSQQRYARLREEAANEFYKRVSDVANIEFAAIGKDLKGILIGGPGPTKETFFNSNHLHAELRKKVLAIKDISYTDEEGLNELVERSQDVLSEAEVVKEKKIVNEFFTLISKNSDKAVYGPADVLKSLEYGAVDKLLLSESFSKLEEYEEKANETGTNVFIISLDTKEGSQLKELGGVAA